MYCSLKLIVPAPYSIIPVPIFAARKGDIGFWWRYLKERDHVEDKSVDGRIILRWIFRKWDVGVWTVSSWIRTGRGGRDL
jgi:hypothetical protein